MWGLWVGLVVLAAGCLVVVEVGRRSTAGTLPRNHLVGLRTTATLADDEAWLIAHRRAGGLLTMAGVAGLALTAAGAVAAALGWPGLATGVLLAATVVLLALTVAACVLGDRAVRRHIASRD